MPTYTSSGSGGDVLLANKVPEAEYMYGCVPTAMAMLLGYYDRYGYRGNDLSNIVEGTVELKSRGTDGNSYDMDAFDTVLGKLAASKEYVYRFHSRDGQETTPEQELEYAFQADNKTLKTDEWNCLADYLGTGQYWRGADNLVTLVSFCSLADLYNNNYSDVKITDGTTTRTVRYNDTTMLPGLDLYVQSRGYLLDYEITGTYQVDVAGGTFTFDDYVKEIDSGRPVLISIEEHVMIGYGYNKKTQEIIFDDCYKVDQRMKWGGTYHYSDADRKLESITVIGFNMNGDVDLALVNTGDSSEKLVLNGTSDGTGTEDYCVAGKGNTAYLTYTVSNLGTKRSISFQVSVYVDGKLFRSSSLDGLNAKKNRAVAVSLGSVSVGMHNVRVVLDESNVIQEVNGANNEAERSFLVLKSGTEVVTDTRQVRTGETAGNLYIHGGTLNLNGGQASGVVLRGKPGGNSYWGGGGRYQQARANVSQGGLLSDTVVYNNGEVNVSGGGAAVNTRIFSSGRMTVREKGTASDTTVESGGTVTVSSGGKLTGKLRLESGASASAGVGAILNFNLSAISPSAAARVNVLSRITGSPVYTLTVSGTQAYGTYKLAGGASKFNQTITVTDTDGTALGELMVKKTLALSHAAYKLKIDKDVLTLSVVANKTPTVKKIKQDITKTTSRDVVVTAVFADDVGLAASLYKIGEDGEWTAYDKKGVTVSGNAVVYFKAVDIGGNESEIGVCDVTNIDKSVVDNGDNNWLYNKTTDPAPNSDENLRTVSLQKGCDPTILLDPDGLVSKEGKQNFVGYGDPADYAKLALACPSKLSFTVNSSDKAKIVIYRIVKGVDTNGKDTYKLKALRTVTLAWNKKAGEYVAKTRALLLETPGETTSYYISVQSTNAKKDGYALYNVTLDQNEKNTKFYVDADNGDNNLLYDKKLKKQGEKALNEKVTKPDHPMTPIASTGEILIDTVPVGEEAQADGWSNFVGFGDATDYVRLSLNATAELTFLVEATDRSKFTVYRLDSKTVNGNVTYTLKTLNAKTLKKAKGAETYTAETKTLLLEADKSYFIAMQSTNASTGGSAYYNVTVSSYREILPAAPQDACALSGPEPEDADASGSVPGGLSMPGSVLTQDEPGMAGGLEICADAEVFSGAAPAGLQPGCGLLA